MKITALERKYLICENNHILRNNEAKQQQEIKDIKIRELENKNKNSIEYIKKTNNLYQKASQNDVIIRNNMLQCLIIINDLYYALDNALK